MAVAWRAGPGVTPVLGEGRMGFCEELPHTHQDLGSHSRPSLFSNDAMTILVMGILLF